MKKIVKGNFVKNILMMGQKKDITVIGIRGSGILGHEFISKGVSQITS